MKKYVCDACGWVYDEEKGLPEEGIAPGTKFEDLPDDFACPLCGVDKDNFTAEEMGQLISYAHKIDVSLHQAHQNLSTKYK